MRMRVRVRTVPTNGSASHDGMRQWFRDRCDNGTEALCALLHLRTRRKKKNKTKQNKTTTAKQRAFPTFERRKDSREDVCLNNKLSKIDCVLCNLFQG